MNGTLHDMALGLQTALSFTNLAYCFFGVFLGTLTGVIPGVGSLAAMSMLFPLTFYLDPTTALIMLSGIWYGTGYGGRVASILVNIPGSTSSAVTCIDGYPMAKQGRGGVALLMTTVASFVGGSAGILLLMLAAPVIANYAMRFGAPEYFSLMVLGLIAASVIADGSAVKGLAMVVLGTILGLVGLDTYTSASRFTFGIIDIMDGISLISLAMGLFGVAEVITSVREVQHGAIDPKSVSLAAMKPTRDDLKRSWKPMLRGSAIGSFFGTLPGTGPSVASFIAYAMEKRLSRTPSRFGKGAIEGVVAPETADNAAEQTSFIPTLVLGIPGSASMALMLGVLMVHGVNPGPGMMTKHPELFWGLVMSFWIGNVLLVILNVPLIGLWVRLMLVPYHFLYPAIMMFVCVGTYMVDNSFFDVWMAALFGLVGYLMRVFGYAAAPLLLGFVLGPMLEENFRRSLLLSRGDPTIFVDRPISAVILGLAVLLLVWTAWSGIAALRREPVPDPAQ